MSNLTNNTAELTKILAAVNALPEAGEGGGDSGDNPVLVGLTAEANGVYLASDDGADGYSVVTVNVPSKEPVLREGSATPTKSQQTINPPSGADGFSKFVVEKIPDEYVVPTGEIEINENGIHPVSDYASVLVDVPDTPAAVRPLEITENGTHSAADEGLDGYSVVTVNVASGGGSAVETCTVEFPYHVGYLWYTNATGNYVTRDQVNAGMTFTVQKNTIMKFDMAGDVPQLTPDIYGDGRLVYDAGEILFFVVTGDCTIAL
jgi:hypothetical protein